MAENYRVPPSNPEIVVESIERLLPIQQAYILAQIYWMTWGLLKRVLAVLFVVALLAGVVLVVGQNELGAWLIGIAIGLLAGWAISEVSRGKR